MDAMVRSMFGLILSKRSQDAEDKLRQIEDYDFKPDESEFKINLRTLILTEQVLLTNCLEKFAP